MEARNQTTCSPSRKVRRKGPERTLGVRLTLEVPCGTLTLIFFFLITILTRTTEFVKKVWTNHSLARNMCDGERAGFRTKYTWGSSID